MDACGGASPGVWPSRPSHGSARAGGRPRGRAGIVAGRLDVRGVDRGARLRRKLAASSGSPQTASYTLCSSLSVNVGPTNAVARSLSWRRSAGVRGRRRRSGGGRRPAGASRRPRRRPATAGRRRRRCRRRARRCRGPTARYATLTTLPRGRGRGRRRRRTGRALGAAMPASSRARVGGLVERLVGLLEAAGERPRAGERLAGAADEHDVQLARRRRSG